MLTVTKPGMRLYESIAPASESAYRRVEERFGTKQLDQLYRLLDQLTASQRTSADSS